MAVFGVSNSDPNTSLLLATTVVQQTIVVLQVGLCVNVVMKLIITIGGCGELSPEHPKWYDEPAQPLSSYLVTHQLLD